MPIKYAIEYSTRKKIKQKKKKNRAKIKELLGLVQTFSFLNLFRGIRNNSQSNTQIGVLRKYFMI